MAETQPMEVNFTDFNPFCEKLKGSNYPLVLLLARANDQLRQQEISKTAFSDAVSNFFYLLTYFAGSFDFVDRVAVDIVAKVEHV